MKIVNMKKQKPLSLEAEKHLFTGLLLFFFFFFLLMHLVYPSRSHWKSLCQINKQGTACSLSVGGKKWWQTLRSPSEPQVKSTAAQQFIYPARKCRCHLYLDV